MSVGREFGFGGGEGGCSCAVDFVKCCLESRRRLSLVELATSHTFTHIYMYIHVYIYIYIYTHVYMYTVYA